MQQQETGLKGELRLLTDQTSHLVKQEVELLKAELNEKTDTLRMKSGMPPWSFGKSPTSPERRGGGGKEGRNRSRSLRRSHGPRTRRLRGAYRSDHCRPGRVSGAVDLLAHRWRRLRTDCRRTCSGRQGGGLAGRSASCSHGRPIQRCRLLRGGCCSPGFPLPERTIDSIKDVKQEGGAVLEPGRLSGPASLDPMWRRTRQTGRAVGDRFPI
jgi:hypothetical protein